MNEPPPPTASQAEDLVRFFRSLRPREREELQRLAAADKEFGEDVQREKGSAG